MGLVVPMTSGEVPGDKAAQLRGGHRLRPGLRDVHGKSHRPHRDQGEHRRIPVVAKHTARTASAAMGLDAAAPVYGIDTGFDMLASVHIDDADPRRLQRNIVLSHAAGVGEPMPVRVVRLMMALELVPATRSAPRTAGAVPLTALG